MVDHPHIDPQKSSASKQAHSTEPHPKSQVKGDWNPPPLTWLGMHFDEDQTKKLWNIITQNVGNEINREKEKAIKAIRKLNPEHADDDD